MADSSSSAAALVAAIGDDVDAGLELGVPPIERTAIGADPRLDEPEPPAPIHGGDDADDVDAGSEFVSQLLDGRPDLSQNAIENLRAQRQRLKEQQKLLRRNLKNQQRVRSRIIKRMRHLDTASVLQVLIERGVNSANLRGTPAVVAAANAALGARAARAGSSAGSAGSSSD